MTLLQLDLSASTGAVFSPCERYRYDLWRRWDSGDVVAFLGLNPSTADAHQDDPTIRRCIGFARAWGFGSMHMLNLYGWRSTDPKPLWDGSVDEPVGPENDEHILRVGRLVRYVVCAWGTFPKAQYRGLEIMDLLQRAGVPTKVLMLSYDGKPRHPLYLSNGLRPKDWRG